MSDRVISFSVPPANKEGVKQIRKLKTHCEKTGTSFSWMVIKAITKQNKEMKL